MIFQITLLACIATSSATPILGSLTKVVGGVVNGVANLVLCVTALDGSVLDVSALYNKHVAVGDWIILDEHKAASLDLLTPEGILRADLEWIKAFKIDNLIFIDSESAARLNLGTPQALADFSLCNSLLGIVLERAGIAKGSSLYVSILNSNGALFTLDALSYSGTFCL